MPEKVETRKEKKVRNKREYAEAKLSSKSQLKEKEKEKENKTKYFLFFQLIFQSIND